MHMKEWVEKGQCTNRALRSFAHSQKLCLSHDFSIMVQFARIKSGSLLEKTHPLKSEMQHLCKLEGTC